jgi:hypothetical protein
LRIAAPADLDMKKPLAAMGMRGCRAECPTRLHKEGNALHRVRVAHRPVGAALISGPQIVTS